MSAKSKKVSSKEMNFIMKINLFMILLLAIAKVGTGMTRALLLSNNGHHNNEDVLHRFTREPRILNIKMICAPGMTYAEGRCRKLL